MIAASWLAKVWLEEQQARHAPGVEGCCGNNAGTFMVLTNTKACRVHGKHAHFLWGRGRGGQSTEANHPMTSTLEQRASGPNREKATWSAFTSMSQFED